MLDALQAEMQQWFGAFGNAGELTLRLAFAALLGALVGVEREVRGHAAGLRTFILVSSGAALAMVVSLSVADVRTAELPGDAAASSGVQVTVDPGRIAYGVMTGVGFLGAGTIIRNRGRIEGLTTAAGIWAVAAIGLAAGLGLYVITLLATLLLLVTLILLRWVDHWLPGRKKRRVRVLVPQSATCVSDFAAKLRHDRVRHGHISVSRAKNVTEGRLLLSTVLRYYRHSAYAELRDRLITDDEVEVDRLG